MKVWASTALVIVAILFATPLVVRAEEPAPTFPNRFMIRAGYGYAFNASSSVTFNGDVTPGAGAVEFETLGGEREDDFWRIDASFHLTPRHAFYFSYYDITRTGRKAITRDITIEDTTFEANSTVNSELDIGLYRLYYNYSFYQSEKLDLALSAGLYVAAVKFKISGELACTGVTECGSGTPLAARSTREAITVPLPSLGLQLNYNILPRLQAQLRFDWLYLEVSGLRGSMTEVYLGAEYRLFKHFAVGAAYDYLNIEAKYKADEKGGWGVQNTWNTVFMYGALYF
jgi:hypothetical protein